MVGNQGGANGGGWGTEEKKGRDGEENNEEKRGAQAGLRRDGMRFLGFAVEGHVFLSGGNVRMLSYGTC